MKDMKEVHFKQREQHVQRPWGRWEQLIWKVLAMLRIFQFILWAIVKHQRVWPKEILLWDFRFETTTLDLVWKTAMSQDKLAIYTGYILVCPGKSSIGLLTQSNSQTNHQNSRTLDSTFSWCQMTANFHLSISASPCWELFYENTEDHFIPQAWRPRSTQQ